jgi:hypothetical protein
MAFLSWCRPQWLQLAESDAMVRVKFEQLTAVDEQAKLGRNET